VRTLAERAGISLPEEDSETREQATENEKLYAACSLAGRFFYDNLGTIEGQLARGYFQHRGFNDDTVRKFGLGYAIHAWDGLVKYAEQEKISPDTMERAGLVIKREDGSAYYDRFRGRAMFPVFSPSGRTVGFGARKMREDDPLGKYINSPETAIYNKSRILYGLFHARDAVRAKEFAILVEGYADMISVFQAGIENVVASSGTALTEEQIRLIGRYAKAVTLVYDADSAGSKAALRGVDLIIENGLEVKVAALPAGEDPDSFIRKAGAEAFQKMAESAVSFLDFKANLFQSEGLLQTPEGQTRAVRSIVETIAKMKDELKRNFYVKHVSDKYGIYEPVLFRELEKLLDQERARGEAAQRRASAETRDRVAITVPAQASPKELPAAERDLLKLMLENGTEMVNYVRTHLDFEAFTNDQARQVLQIVLQHVRNNSDWDITSLVNETDEIALKHLIADAVFSKYEISKGWAEIDSMPEEVNPWEVAEQCIMIMRRRKVEDLISENQRRMKEASARGAPVQEYLERHHALLQEKKSLGSMRFERKTSVP
jgi:DNA primase